MVLECYLFRTVPHVPSLDLPPETEIDAINLQKTYGKLELLAAQLMSIALFLRNVFITNCSQDQ